VVTGVRAQWRFLVGVSLAAVVVLGAAVVSASYRYACSVPPALEPTSLSTGGVGVGNASQPSVGPGIGQVLRTMAMDASPLDAVRWLAHRGIIWLIQLGGCDQRAVALEWIRAAWHASSPDELATAAAGLHAALALVGDPAETGRRLCGMVDAQPREPWLVVPESRQRAALVAAGIACT
jgi:hypothetical protein